MLKYAIEVFKEEAKAILNLINLLDDNFENVVNAILNTKGRVIVTGIGKSGTIGKKISSTLASTGTPSFFLHPAEAFHGDLGMIKSQDIIIAITNSGETDEILKLVPFIKDNGNLIIAITGNPNSTLAVNSNYHLNIHVDKEVCPLDLSPTSSATTTLVMGDALVVALMNERRFRQQDYARFHPGGNLGRRLLIRMKDIMKKQDLPLISENSLMPDIIQSISAGGCGLAIITDVTNQVLGIITDGDIRKCMQSKENSFFVLKAKEIMNRNPILINQNVTINEAEQIFKERKINTIIVVEDRKIIGLVPYKKLYEN